MNVAPDIADELPWGEDDTETCPTCGGTGLSDEDGFDCEDCDGNGYTEI